MSQRDIARHEIAVAALLDRFYGLVEGPGAVDWRIALEGEELMIDVFNWDDADARIEAVTYMGDGVRQVAQPAPFDAVRCAAALDRALDSRGDHDGRARRTG